MKKILVVAVEAKPYATAGGTSDVVGALAGALREKGYDVRLVLPHYGTIIRAPRYQVEQIADLDVPVGSNPLRASVCRTNQNTYLIGGELPENDHGVITFPSPIDAIDRAVFQFTDHHLTLETLTSWAMEQRINIHVEAVSIALDALP